MFCGRLARMAARATRTNEGNVMIFGNKWLVGCLAVAATALVGGAAAQQRSIAIATGGTGGVYYPLGGGLANILTKSLPGLQAAAELTGRPPPHLQPTPTGPAAP